MSKVQQLITIDEIDAAELGQLWMDALAKKVTPDRLSAEITCETVKDTTITTMWSKGRPVAIEIRQRTEFNSTVMTLIEVDNGQSPQGK